jgi:hypothetical protein
MQKLALDVDPQATILGFEQSRAVSGQTFTRPDDEIAEGNEAFGEDPLDAALKCLFEIDEDISAHDQMEFAECAVSGEIMRKELEP